MKALSDTELVIAEWYCHGLTDKEIADVLEKTCMDNSYPQEAHLYETRYLHDS